MKSEALKYATFYLEPDVKIPADTTGDFSVILYIYGYLWSLYIYGYC
jgi:hypothetical protein